MHRQTDRQMDIIVYIPHIVCMHCIHAQHKYIVQYLDTYTVYIHSIHTKHTWTKGQTDGWTDRWMVVQTGGWTDGQMDIHKQFTYPWYIQYL